MSEVEIYVGDRKFTISCNPGEEKDVLLASEELDKEAKNIVKSIGKVSDDKLLLMAGLMIAGRIKIIDEDVSRMSKEISELEHNISTLREENRRLESLENETQINDKAGHNNSNMDEDTFEKILYSINNRLSSLIQEEKEEIDEDKKLVNFEETTKNNSDQQELF